MLKSYVPVTNLKGCTARVFTGDKLLRTYESCVFVVGIELETFIHNFFSVLKAFYRDENSICNK